MRAFFLLLLAAGFHWNGDKVARTDAEWRSELGPERYNVMRLKATERAFVGRYTRFDAEGIYLCAACDLSLFHSDAKYNIGIGWPTFKEPIHKKNIYYLEDWNLGFKRYEVLCRRCDCHLGHVFNDGPPPKHLRYMINSIALKFRLLLSSIEQENESSNRD